MAKRGWAPATVLSAISLATSLPAPASENPKTKTLELVWRDHHELVRDSERVGSETARIFETLAVSLRWEDGTNREPEARGGARVQVVLMPSEPSGWKLPKNALGAVLLPDRERQETVYLFYPAILRSVGLGHRVDAMLTPREQKDTARAIARVVVHEVVHAIDPNIAHAEQGLMREALSAATLSRSESELDELSTRAFHEGLDRSGRDRLSATRPPEQRHGRR